MALVSNLGYGGFLSAHEPTKKTLAATHADLLRYVPIIGGSLWDELEGLSLSLASGATALMAALGANTVAVRLQVQNLAAEVEEHRSALAALATAESAEAEVARQAFVDVAAEKLGSAEEGRERVDDLLAGRRPLTRLDEILAKASRDAQKNTAVHIVAAEAMRGRASYFAAFHAARSTVTEEDEFLEESDLGFVTALTEDARAFVGSSFASLYDTLTGEVSTEALLASALAAATGSTLRLAMCGELQGQLSRLKIPVDLLPSFGPLAVELAETAVRLRLLLAYSSYVTVALAMLDADTWQAKERSVALKSPLASAVPTGSSTPIVELDNAPEDVLVEVQGVVESISIDPDPGPKFSTFVNLRAFEGSATVRLRAHMFSLKANGVATGAACKVRGFVRRSKSWLEGSETGLDVDRVSLTELRVGSWLDDVTYRMRPFAMVFLNEMNLFHTPGEVV